MGKKSNDNKINHPQVVKQNNNNKKITKKWLTGFDSRSLEAMKDKRVNCVHSI